MKSFHKVIQFANGRQVRTSRALFFDSRFAPQPTYHSNRNGEGRDR